MTARQRTLGISRFGWVAAAAWRLPGAPYLAALFAALAVFLLRWPIFAGDADLWYHLAAGRVIGTTGEVPRQAVGTFLERPWNDYYWLFQLVCLGGPSRRRLPRAGAAAGGAVRGAGGSGDGAAAAVAAAGPAVAGGERWSRCCSCCCRGSPRCGRSSSRWRCWPSACWRSSEADGWLVTLPLAAVLWANAHGVSWPVLRWSSPPTPPSSQWQAVRGRAPADLRARALAIAAAGAGVLGDAARAGAAAAAVPLARLRGADDRRAGTAARRVAGAAHRRGAGTEPADLVQRRRAAGDRGARAAGDGAATAPRAPRPRRRRRAAPLARQPFRLRGRRPRLAASWSRPPPTPQPKAMPARLARVTLLQAVSDGGQSCWVTNNILRLQIWGR